MEHFIDIAKYLFAKSDPLMVGCFLILAVMLYKVNKKIDNHLDPKNQYPHPECEWGERNFKALTDSLKNQHTENREDHQQIFSKIDILLRQGK